MATAVIEKTVIPTKELETNANTEKTTMPTNELDTNTEKTTVLPNELDTNTEKTTVLPNELDTNTEKTKTNTEKTKKQKVKAIKVEKTEPTEKKVMYYSVTVPNYNSIIQTIQKTLFITSNEHSGIYVKTETSLKKYNTGATDVIDLTEEATKILETKFADHINKLKLNENFIIDNENMYVVNSEFHVTTLFTGGKPHEKSSEVEQQIGCSVSINVNKLGVSDNFIVFGVESLKTDDGKDVVYYGNDVKHVTIALKSTLNKKEKVLAKDSYTALENGKTHDVGVVVKGLCISVSP